MSPNINSGDDLLVDMEPSSLLFGVYVLLLNGGLIVKRLAPKSEGTILVSSDNAIYPPDEIRNDRIQWLKGDAGDNLRILGRVAYRFQAMS
jgi:phage repressor protein C with HTH and peptisase S24 domain